MSDIYVFNINWRRFELYMFNFYEMIDNYVPELPPFECTIYLLILKDTIFCHIFLVKR